MKRIGHGTPQPKLELPRDAQDVFLQYSLLKLPDAALSHAMLVKAAVVATPVARKRGWRIGHLKEFAPKNASLQGLNVNQGSQICVRCRSANGGFFDEDHVLGTLLHELVHIVHGSHSAQFYDMLKELWIEAEAVMFRQRFNISEDSASRNWGSGRTLGGNISIEQARIRNFSFGQRLGGSSANASLPAREAAARAALARLRMEDGETCATQEILSDESDSEEVIPVDTSDSASSSSSSRNGTLEIRRIGKSTNAPICPKKTFEIVVLDDSQCDDENKDSHYLGKPNALTENRVAGISFAKINDASGSKDCEDVPARQDGVKRPNDAGSFVDLTCDEPNVGGGGCSWACLKCAYENVETNLVCESCLDTVQPGRWRCERCSFVNIDDHLQCFACHTIRTHNDH